MHAAWVSILETTSAAVCLYAGLVLSPSDVRDWRRRFLGLAALGLSVLAQFTADCESVLLKAALLSAGASIFTKVLDQCFLRRAAPVWLGSLRSDVFPSRLTRSVGKPISKWKYAALLSQSKRLASTETK
jgi:hypothetical protein